MNSPDRDGTQGHWQQFSQHGSQPGYPTPGEQGDQRFAAAVAAREAMMAGRAPVVPAADPSLSRRPWEVVVAGVVVMTGFASYAWRMLVGTGRARWVALVCLALGFFVITPLSPLLIGGFLLLGTLSVVFAFLPDSSAWFAQQRRNRAAPEMRGRPGGTD